MIISIMRKNNAFVLVKLTINSNYVMSMVRLVVLNNLVESVGQYSFIVNLLIDVHAMVKSIDELGIVAWRALRPLGKSLHVAERSALSARAPWHR